MNARMYAVTPAVEAAWRALLEHVTQDARVPLTYVPYPAPQPLEQLWARGDLGSVLMCGYPIALRLAAVTPIAAPIPRAEGAAHRAGDRDRKSTRLNSSHGLISFAVFCLKKKKQAGLRARTERPYLGNTHSMLGSDL